MRIAGALCATLVCLAIIAIDFRSRLGGSPPPHPQAAVVVTGAFGRIEKGLALLEEGAVDLLFISGVNAPSGLNIRTFADQFELTPTQRSALADGRLMLGLTAKSTFDNGIETACWLRSNPEITDLLVITSADHMPRASLALDRSSPNHVTLHRLSVPTAHWDPEEPIKFAITWFVTLLPGQFWPGTSSCEPGLR